MGIVIAKNAFAKGLMQGQRVPNSVRYAIGRFYSPSFKLDSVATTLVKDLVVQVDECGNSMVFTHATLYHPLINNSSV